MFMLPKETELTTELLYKMLNRFNLNVLPKLQKYKNYYDGTQAILCKHYADASKPCNRVVTNYCADIVSSYCGYIASPGYINYSSDNDIEAIMEQIGEIAQQFFAGHRIIDLVVAEFVGQAITLKHGLYQRRLVDVFTLLRLFIYP